MSKVMVKLVSSRLPVDSEACDQQIVTLWQGCLHEVVLLPCAAGPDVGLHQQHVKRQTHAAS